MGGQTWDPERYRRNARFVAELGEPLLDLLAPAPGERILDLGCGDGALTEKLAARGCQVVGVDASAAQVQAARARGLDARVMDGAALDFDGEFDAVFSNAALHWMAQPRAVTEGVWRALRPGGRFVAEFGGAGNVAAVRAALHRISTRHGIDPTAADPWYFPAPEAYRVLLQSQGFQVEHLQHFERPTPLPGDIRGWLETFCGSFLAALPVDRQGRFLDEVREALGALCGADGRWVLDYVRLRVVAHRPRAV
ncbi:MAG: SAM-dependent methyltransferase [Chromatiales bacterium 21-64-14]|nr:MAG: SAM-dependent methyltransferase [Chromatiales bacterium 21-64-14]HQU16360.1 methyltransferase domain-containing protein [Gammaproteobacteria bacterium]